MFSGKVFFPGKENFVEGQKFLGEMKVDTYRSDLSWQIWDRSADFVIESIFCPFKGFL